METMLALVKKEAKPGLWLDEVPVPRIGINDVLIKVLRTGICGTDIHIEAWDAWARKTIPVPPPTHSTSCEAIRRLPTKAFRGTSTSWMRLRRLR